MIYSLQSIQWSLSVKLGCLEISRDVVLETPVSVSRAQHSRPISCGLGLDTYGLGLKESVSNIFKTSTLSVFLLFLIEKNDSNGNCSLLILV